MIRFIPILGAVALAACAPSPSQIDAIDPGPGFAAMPCKQVLPALRAEEVVYAELVAQQERTAKTDAATVAVVGLPIGSLSGKNVKDDLAVSKGKVKALRARQDACG